MKDEEELHKDEDCPDVVNCGEECPMCQSTEGYKIIGRIAPYEEQAATVDESIASKRPARKIQKQINESVNPGLFKKLKNLYKKDEDVAYNLAADPFSLPSPFDEYGESLLNAAYTKFQTDCNGELESSLESGTGMSEFRGEGVYARWDFDDEIEMIEEALSECDTEDEFIKSVVGGLSTLVDFNEQAEELDESAGNKKLTNIEKISKKTKISEMYIAKKCLELAQKWKERNERKL